MKKKITIVIGTIAAVAILGVGIYHSDASQSEFHLTTDDIEEMVTAQYPGDVTDINLEKQADQSVYQVDIENDARKYALTLDSRSGEVLELKETSDPEQVKIAKKKKEEKEAEQRKKDSANTEKKEDNSKKQADDNSKPDSTEKKNTVISVDEATEIALGQYSGEIDEVELDEEDGRLIYEVEVENGEEEAEIEIDAHTGEVLVVSIERD